MSRGVAGGIRKTQPKANIPNPNAAITWIIFEEGFIAASVHRRRAGDALHENIHASAFLCGEPLRLNFKSHKVQEAFTAEDAEDFAEVRRGTLRRKSFTGICPSQTRWDAFREIDLLERIVSGKAQNNSETTKKTKLRHCRLFDHIVSVT